MGMQTGGGGGSLSEINVTPLVDVMLVLLVIFMVTAPMLSSKKTEIQLPPFETGETLDLKDDDIIFSVDKKKEIRFYNCPNCASMDLASLVDKLKDNPKVKQAQQVFLYADQDLPYRVVLQVMAKMNQAGIKRVGLVTNPGGPTSEKPPPRP
jgi:biopolymer transport protein TolR